MEAIWDALYGREAMGEAACFRLTIADLNTMYREMCKDHPGTWIMPLDGQELLMAPNIALPGQPQDPGTGPPSTL